MTLLKWSKAAVLKTVERRRSQGSNPCLSAIGCYPVDGPQSEIANRIF